MQRWRSFCSRPHANKQKTRFDQPKVVNLEVVNPEKSSSTGRELARGSLYSTSSGAQILRLDYLTANTVQIIIQLRRLLERVNLDGSTHLQHGRARFGASVRAGGHAAVPTIPHPPVYPSDMWWLRCVFRRFSLGSECALGILKEASFLHQHRSPV